MANDKASKEMKEYDVIAPFIYGSKPFRAGDKIKLEDVAVPHFAEQGYIVDPKAVNKKAAVTGTK